MNFRGETLDNLHIGDVNITEDLTVDGNHVIVGDLEVKTVEIEQINPLPPATDIKINTDLDLSNNAIENIDYIKGTAGTILEIKSGDAGGVVDIWSTSGAWKSNDGLTTAFSVDTNIFNQVQMGSNIDLDMNNNEIKNVTQLTSSTQINMPQNLDMVGNGIYGVSELRGFDGNSLLLNTFADGSGLIIEEGGEIQAEKPLNLLSNSISGVSSLTIDGNSKNTIIDNDFNTFDAGSVNSFNVNTGGTHDFTINNQQKFTIDTLATYRLPVKLLNSALQFQTTANIETIGTSNINIDLDGEFLDIASDPITDNALEFTTSLNNFSFNKNVILPSINSNIVYVRTAADLPTPSGGFHTLQANIGYVIVGSVTLNNGIQFGTNNAIRGADFNSVLIFDETANDIIGFQAVDNNVYISNLTVQGGGGHFAGGVVGLFDCVDIDTGGSPPFYARNKRFKVDGVNILSAYKLGRVQGFGTLNFNNNFINGGGGSPTGIYTVDGLKVSDGLSLEFNNNKMVLFAGAQIASTAIMLEFTPNLAPSNAGFNAVTIAGNIFHPRNNENAIKFNDASTTELGVISSNTFIRTGGTAPLIDYPNQSTFDNYNPECIETYTVDSNVGVTNSEPNVKAHFINSNNISSTSYTDIVLVQNIDFTPQKLSSRFGVELVVTGMITPGPDFVDFETITNLNTGFTALVLKAEPRGIGITEQTIYICDMTGAFDNGPIRNQVSTQTSGGCDINPTFCYGEKDPRKLNLVCNITLDGTGNQVFNAAPALDTGSGFVVDTVCESRTFANATGLGGTFTVACQNVFQEADKIKIQVKADTGGNFNVLNYVLTIK